MYLRVRATLSRLLGAPAASRQTSEGARILVADMMAATVCRLDGQRTDAGALSRDDARLSDQLEKLARA